MELTSNSYLPISPLSPKCMLLMPAAVCLGCLGAKLMFSPCSSCSTTTAESDPQLVSLPCQQSYVLFGSSVAVAIAAAGWAFSTKFVGATSTTTNLDLSYPLDRLAYALHWDVLMAVPVALGIQHVATTRFMSASAIGGEQTEDVEMGRRFLQNTCEQLAIALPTHAALAMLLPPERVPSTLPLLVSLWLTGRVLFWFGYRYGQKRLGAGGRSVGFALTFAPTAAALAYTTYRFFTSTNI